MPWYAKPKWGYNLSQTDTEIQANIRMINGFLNSTGYYLYAQAGILGNMYAESGINPWRWQNESVDLTDRYKGYGLFQYTPAYEYVNNCSTVEGYAPNLSIPTPSAGAMPHDGWAQMIVFDEDLLGKWSSRCWGWGWDPSEYPELYLLRQGILDTWGNGSSITQEQFKSIGGQSFDTNLISATFVFLACFEQPAVPNLNERVQYARIIYPWLDGTIPPEPPTPGGRKRGLKVWQMALRHR